LGPLCIQTSLKRRWLFLSAEHKMWAINSPPPTSYLRLFRRLQRIFTMTLSGSTDKTVPLWDISTHVTYWKRHVTRKAFPAVNGKVMRCQDEFDISSRDTLVSIFDFWSGTSARLSHSAAHEHRTSSSSSSKSLL